jgi:hypothetical protein
VVRDEPPVAAAPRGGKPTVVQSPPGQAAPRTTGSPEAGGSRGAAAAAQPKAIPKPIHVEQNEATVKNLIEYWKERIRKEPPNGRQEVYENYIKKLESEGKRSIADVNERVGELKGEQSEEEARFLLGSGEQTYQTPFGETRPDARVGKQVVEIKNWNVVYASEAEVRQAAAGGHPAKLQGLVDQVERRKSLKGLEQVVVIDIRGQLNIRGSTPAQVLEHRRLIDVFGKVVQDATGLPGNQIVILTW